ncbi:MAG: SRPBCC family protein [Solirubrobacterales bacterium]
MAQQEIDERATTTAEPAAVWELLADSSTWPSWTSIDSHEQERPPGPDGTGEIRRFKNGPLTIREEIVEVVEQRRFSYSLLSGLPVKSYGAEIDLSATDEGTEIRWHTTFEPKVPGTGLPIKLVLTKATKDFVSGLVEASGS